MLFGNGNPWMGGGRPAPMRQRQPAAQPAAQPAPQPAASPYPAPTWLGPTGDGTYSSGLANYYAGQLQNQQVPGSVPTPAAAPAPVASPTPVPPSPAPGPITNPGFRDHPQPGFGRHNRFASLFGEGGPFANMFGNHQFGGAFQQPSWLNGFRSAFDGWMANRPSDVNQLANWAQSAPTMNAFRPNGAA